MLPDVLITRAQGGLGRQQPTNDGISALITQGVAVVNKLALDTDYELRSVLAAEAIGIAAAGTYAHLHYHLSEYFRLSPGAVLILRVVAQTVPMADMLDRTLPHAKSLLLAANGRVKQLAAVLNPAAGYVPDAAEGIDADVLAAMAKAQALAVEEFAQHRPVVILLAGHSLAADPADAPDLRQASSDFVSVIAGTDRLLAQGEPAIGTLLGAVSAASVNESVAWVQKFNLTGDGSFLSAGLSNGKALGQLLPGHLEAFADKGFIVARQHAGIDGFYFSDSPTCTVASSDYAYLENVRTSNKAARLVRTALLPSLNGPLLVNSDGTLAAQVVGELQGKAVAGLNAMSQAGEISGQAVYIDPTQNVVSTSVLNVQVRLVPVGVGRQIKVDLGLSTKL